MKIIWRILFGLNIMFFTLIFIDILIMIYYLTYNPQNLPCLMCVGCPCPYMDFLRAKEYYLNFLFPIAILLNLLLIIISTVLIVILKYNARAFKFANLKKKLSLRKIYTH
ncbi:MAG: hypothetical protein ACFE88_12715 [Candidatus Hermodarchaeota archaeon]